MSAKTENFYFNSELILYTPSKSPLAIDSLTLSFTKEKNTLRECRISFQVNLELYRHIDKEALFHLKPELRASLLNGDFQPELNIEIQATLQPDLLSFLEEYTKPNAAVAYLEKLCQEQPENPLLLSESWYALYVKQKLESGETGYCTFWSYVNPSVIVQENLSKQQINEAMVDFFQDWFDANLSGITQEYYCQSFEEITKSFEEFVDTTLKSIPEKTSNISAKLSNLDEKLTNVANEVISRNPIFEQIAKFFTQDGWQYTKMKGEPVLHLMFQGENAQWNCYAKAREKQQQMVFYSICPVKVPENKRLAMAELITKTNFGTIVGNFQMDFNDGEISCRTSIHVEGDRLSFALIKNLVYGNVSMMDEYLPLFLSVIDGGVNPL
jgi:hypothetical protein